MISEIDGIKYNSDNDDDVYDIRMLYRRIDSQLSLDPTLTDSERAALDAKLYQIDEFCNVVMDRLTPEDRRGKGGREEVDFW